MTMTVWRCGILLPASAMLCASSHLECSTNAFEVIVVWCLPNSSLKEVAAVSVSSRARAGASSDPALARPFMLIWTCPRRNSMCIGQITTGAVSQSKRTLGSDSIQARYADDGMRISASNSSCNLSRAFKVFYV